MKTKTAIIAFSTSALVLTLASFFWPKPCCGGGEDQMEFERNLGLAMDGDSSAAERLYRDSLEAGHASQARYWALMGAMDGSQSLTSIYLAIRRSSIVPIPSDDVIIQKNMSKQGARFLAEQIRIAAGRDK